MNAGAILFLTEIYTGKLELYEFEFTEVFLCIWCGISAVVRWEYSQISVNWHPRFPAKFLTNRIVNTNFYYINPTFTIQLWRHFSETPGQNL